MIKSVFNTIVLLFGLLIANDSNAQVQSIRISINGLTCSQCSKSVEMRLKKVPFITQVAMDLQNTEAKVSINKSKAIDLTKVAKAVTDAGFSVNSLWVMYEFPSSNYGSNKCIKTKDGIFVLTDNNSSKTQECLVLGKKFNASKQFQQTPNALKDITCKGALIYYLQAS